nr:DNA mismatch repair protein MLH3-like [Halyomorpha halys]
MVEEQLHSIKTSRSPTNVIPNILHKQICKTACSSAIKFGQNLSLMDCCNLIDKLSKCNIPFLCAHGRPTAFYISGITLSDENPTPPTLKRLKQINIE